VALLPYLDEVELYKQFHLDEPWDSPHNKKLLRKMPKVYAPPGGATREPYTTYYQVFVGPRAAFEERRATMIPASFPDGLSNILLVVEAGRPVPWTKPEDLPFTPDGPLPALGGLFPGIFNAAFGDGSVHALSTRADPAQLRLAIMRDDGETLNLERLEVPSGAREIELRQQRDRLQEELARERDRLQELRRQKELLEEMANDPAIRRLQQENAQLEQALRRMRQEAERMAEEIRRLRQPTERRGGGPQRE
jgi:hypothetical protein